jgi:hypothetical protein
MRFDLLPHITSGKGVAGDLVKGAAAPLAQEAMSQLVTRIAKDAGLSVTDASVRSAVRILVAVAQNLSARYKGDTKRALLDAANGVQAVALTQSRGMDQKGLGITAYAGSMWKKAKEMAASATEAAKSAAKATMSAAGDWRATREIIVDLGEIATAIGLIDGDKFMGKVGKAEEYLGRAETVATAVDATAKKWDDIQAKRAVEAKKKAKGVAKATPPSEPPAQPSVAPPKARRKKKKKKKTKQD